MKILTICAGYYPESGGIQNVIRYVNEHLHAQGHSTTVICLSDNPDCKNEIINGVKIFRVFDKFYQYLYKYSLSFKNFFNNNKDMFDDSDIIHVHAYHSLFSWQVINLLVNNGYSSKIIFNPHYEGVGFSRINNLLHKPYGYLAKSSIEKSRFIVCVSNYEKSLLTKRFNINYNRIKVISNGINYPIICMPIKKKIPHYVNILYVGRLEYYKGIQYILQTISLLNQKEKNFYLKIVGQGSYSKKLRELASSLNLDNVQFLGHVNDTKLEELYTSSDIFILLSESESYGIVVAEALAHGLVTIIAKTTALSEFIEFEGCIGVDYPPDVHRLVSLLESLIGSEVIIGPFDINKIRNWDVVSKEYEEIYKEINYLNNTF